MSDVQSVLVGKKGVIEEMGKVLVVTEIDTCVDFGDHQDFAHFFDYTLFANKYTLDIRHTV